MSIEIKGQMVNAILTQMKIHNETCSNPEKRFQLDDMFFALIFRTDRQLKQLAKSIGAKI